MVDFQQPKLAKECRGTLAFTKANIAEVPHYGLFVYVTLRVPSSLSEQGQSGLAELGVHSNHHLLRDPSPLV